jgi:hypothetical protein
MSSGHRLEFNSTRVGLCRNLALMVHVSRIDDSESLEFETVRLGQFTTRGLKKQNPFSFLILFKSMWSENDWFSFLAEEESVRTSCVVTVLVKLPA